MSLPPSFLRMGFGGGPRVWLPLFLLWPLFALVALLVLPLTAIADVILYLAGAPFHSCTLLFLGAVQIVNATRGLTVYVRNDTTTIDLKLI